MIPGAHDRRGVPLTDAERRSFERIVSAMWVLRVTRGRRSTVFRRGWSCLVGAIAGIVFSVASLGVASVAISFAGFVFALMALTEFSRIAADSGWWRRVLRLPRLRYSAPPPPDERAA